MKINIAFFGTPKESVIVLEKLFNAGYPIACCITKPAKSLGRKKIITDTPVAQWAKSHRIPLLTPETHPQKPTRFENENKLTAEIMKYRPELLVTADYTQKIPMKLVKKIKFGGLNIHPSLLPQYKGPAPIPWAILKGEKETGVSIATLTDKFDEGRILIQEKSPILNTDSSPILLERLFTQGADLLIKILPEYLKSTSNFELRTNNPPSYFPRLTRETGFVPWKIIEASIKGQPVPENELPAWPIAKYFEKSYLIHHSSFIIHHSFRAFYPWPGLWTEVNIQNKISLPSRQAGNIKKRLKILSLALQPATNKLQLKTLQLEGKNQVSGRDTQIFLQKIIS